MSGYGETYVEVDANAVNGGVMTMAASGPDIPPEGGESGTWTLFWRYDETSGGFTGVSWYFENQHNKLDDIWMNTNPVDPQGNPYKSTNEDFQRYLNDYNVQDLDEYFKYWTDSSKGQFSMDLIYVQGPNTSCVRNW